MTPLRNLLLSLLLLLLSGCYRADTPEDSPFGNYDALWTLIDEHYCYLDYKHINWEALGARYRTRLTPDMSDYALFEVMDSLLYQLRDGHVNLAAPHNITRYDFWATSPRNFYEHLIESDRYLGRSYNQAGGLQYRVLPDNVGYLRYGSFSSALGESSLDHALADLALCNGLIIDVRHNGGGNADYAGKFAARFTNERVLVGYILHKTGPGHSQFSDPHPIYLEPSPRIRWQKPVVVLTNRHTFSAANDFVCRMKELPHVTVLGDSTGGGGGLPFSSELPNGWAVRFSASPVLDCRRQHIEWGIAPHEKLDLDSADVAAGIDTHIERARHLISTKHFTKSNEKFAGMR